MDSHFPTANAFAATILIVDDTPENLKVLGELLQPLYRVLAANSGEHALRLAASENKPDLILLDVMMPGMDGYAVLDRLSKRPETSDIPVIFVTALDAAEDEQRGLDLGAVDYITKPVRPPIVLARVRTQLEIKRARDWLRLQNASLESEVARRAAENELILAAAGEGIYGVDAGGTINFVNPAAARMLGYPQRELLGRRTQDILHDSGITDLADDSVLRATLAAGVGVLQREGVVWRQDGTPLPVEFCLMPIVRDGKVLGAVTTFMDISERKRYLEQLERRSNYDELTSLPNRNLLRDRMSHAIGRARQEKHAVTLLVLNLDRFKEVNDTLGRDCGDRILCLVAQRLGELSKRVDSIARVASDEFVLLGQDDGTEIALAQACLAQFSAPLALNEREIFLTASIGIAVFPKDGDDGETLLRNATAAMYKAKAVGGNAFRFYSAEMNSRSLERLEMENDLRRALERDELVLYYQPQVSMRNGEIIGCEALLRWQHPQHGLLPPGRFIPLAEDTGLIVAIGEWVLRAACLQNKAWQDAGLPAITVAVNMSAHQFAAQDVVEMTHMVLRETGIDPKLLELELTESAVMADAEIFIHATERLKALQVTLSIDDFGTGFSSLSYLKRFTIDRLKMDISFVRDIAHDPNSASIAQAIISLSHNLKLSVIAEGVETEAQLNFLRTRGCDEMQGFYFSKPVPAAEFEQMLRERRKLVFPSGGELPPQTILLVDDEVSILSALKRLFRREGYNILTADNGRAGLEQMASHEVGVVISDARMPQMGGPEFLSKAREMHPDCVRIMLSGYTDLQAVTEAVNKGEVFKFLTKPWNDEELLETVHAAFRIYRQRRPGRAAPAGGLQFDA